MPRSFANFVRIHDPFMRIFFYPVFPPSLMLILLLSGVMIVQSCRQDASSKEKFALELWSSNNPGEIRFSQWAVDEWNKKNPQHQVKFQPIPEGQSSEEILLAAVVAGTTPDIYSNIWQGLVEFYGSSGVLVALDTLDGFMEALHMRCDSATIREITSADGHIYQVPWKINPIMTIYNKDLLEEIGLDSMPSTYEGFLEAARKFKKDTDGDGYVDQWFGNTSIKLAWYQRLFNFYPLYLAASGGMPLIENDKAVFNNEYAIGVFRFLATLYKENLFSRQVESAAQDLFVAEKYASKWTGPWEIRYLDQFAKVKYEYDYSAIVVPDGHQGPAYTYCDPKNIVIFNTCKDPQRAIDFILTMIDEEGDRQFLEMSYQLPRRKKMDSLEVFSPFFDANPMMRTFAAQANFVKGADNCSVMVEVFDILSQEYEACVLYGQKSPEQAITDAEKAVNILLSSAPK